MIALTDAMKRIEAEQHHARLRTKLATDADRDDFNRAFGAARAAGLAEFEWRGDRYHTRLDSDRSPTSAQGVKDTP